MVKTNTQLSTMPEKRYHCPCHFKAPQGNVLIGVKLAIRNHRSPSPQLQMFPIFSWTVLPCRRSCNATSGGPNVFLCNNNKKVSNLTAVRFRDQICLSAYTPWTAKSPRYRLTYQRIKGKWDVYHPWLVNSYSDKRSQHHKPHQHLFTSESSVRSV